MLLHVIDIDIDIDMENGLLFPYRNDIMLISVSVWFLWYSSVAVFLTAECVS